MVLQNMEENIREDNPWSSGYATAFSPDRFDQEEFDISDKKISLGIKQLQDNPWDTIESKYTVGSDYDGIDCLPKEFIDCTSHLLIIDGLKKRNYSENEIAKIMGKNFLRVYQEIKS